MHIECLKYYLSHSSFMTTKIKLLVYCKVFRFYLSFQGYRKIVVIGSFLADSSLTTCFWQPKYIILMALANPYVSKQLHNNQRLLCCGFVEGLFQEEFSFLFHCNVVGIVATKVSLQSHKYFVAIFFDKCINITFAKHIFLQHCRQ